MKNQITRLIVAAFAVVSSLSLDAAAQSNWLDMQPLPNWNSRSRAILRTERMRPADLAQCRRFTRPPTLLADRLLTQQGWTLVGPAQVFGRTTVVTVAQSFDGMCRPLEFQALVFVGNRVAGTMSPGPMSSRTDGSLVNVRMLSETDLTAEYVRYGENDALCCPSRIEAVSFTIRPDGANFLLIPETKTPIGTTTGNQQPADAAPLNNTVWRWQRSETPTGRTDVDRPESYQLEFTPEGRVRVRADCNRGTGSYQAEGRNLTFSRVALTRAMCPPGSLDRQFLLGLERAQTYSIEGNALLISGAGANDTMYFFRVSRQN